VYTDPEWNLYHVDTPIEFKYKRLWWRPWLYKYYDDLYLNQKLEPKFTTNFLYTSWFLKNLYLDKIKNPFLLANKTIYENYFVHSKFNSEDFESRKINFSANPHLFIYQLILKIKRKLNERYYFRDIFIKKKKEKKEA
jgi:hypothetical protein